ncbi:MAG: hypothetical protein AB8G15_07495 [Saprospiraceae bacterium]
MIALISLIPLSSFLSQTVGQSLSLNRSLAKFDYLFLSDFYNTYGEGVQIILNQSIVLVILNFLFSIFLMGGLVASIRKRENKFSFNEFWKNCAYYFGRIFRLTVYFLVFQGILLGILFMLLLANGISPFEVESETELIHHLNVLFTIYLFFATIFFMIQDYAKIHLVYQDKKIIARPIYESFRFVIKNFFHFLFLYLLNVATFFLLCFVYYQLNHLIQPDDMTTITLVFLLGQVFILGRIITKILNLASADHLYRKTILTEENSPQV